MLAVVAAGATADAPLNCVDPPAESSGAWSPVDQGRGLAGAHKGREAARRSVELFSTSKLAYGSPVLFLQVSSLRAECDELAEARRSAGQRRRSGGLPSSCAPGSSQRA